MNIEFLDSDQTPTERDKQVQKNSELKEWLVDYVGNKKSETDEVTVEMIVEVFAEDFPEFLLVLAEENYFRGYEQAFSDMTIKDKLAKLENEEVYPNEKN